MDEQACLSPHQLRVLLHYSYSPMGVSFADENNVLHGGDVDMFVEMGAMNRTGDDLELTELGRAWVRLILRVPIPTVHYIDAAGNRVF